MGRRVQEVSGTAAATPPPVAAHPLALLWRITHVEVVLGASPPWRACSLLTRRHFSCGRRQCCALTLREPHDCQARALKRPCHWSCCRSGCAAPPSHSEPRRPALRSMLTAASLVLGEPKTHSWHATRKRWSNSSVTRVLQTQRSPRKQARGSPPCALTAPSLPTLTAAPSDLLAGVSRSAFSLENLARAVVLPARPGSESRASRAHVRCRPTSSLFHVKPDHVSWCGRYVPRYWRRDVGLPPVIRLTRAPPDRSRDCHALS